MPLCRRLLFHLHLREKEQGPRMDKQPPRGKSPAAGELGGRPQACRAVEAGARAAEGRAVQGAPPPLGEPSLSTRVCARLALGRPGGGWGTPGLAAWSSCRRKCVKTHLSLVGLAGREHCLLGPPSLPPLPTPSPPSSKGRLIDSGPH